MRPKNGKLLKYASSIKKVSESLYNYFSVHHIISMTSLAIYLQYEHFGKSCSKRTCLFSDAELSATKIIKLEVFVTIILISGQSIHFFRILVLMYQHKWYGLQGELDQERIRYRQIHQQLMRSGFGMGYDFEMKRFGLNKG